MDFTSFLGGLFGGTIGVLTSHGFDTLRVVHQSDKKGCNIGQCAVDIWKKNGIRGFYRGVTPMIAAVSVEKCIVFGSYENIRRMLLGRFKNKYHTTFVSGVLAGLLCTPSVAAFEKMKVLLQNGKAAQKTNIFRGLSATFFREVPGYGIYFTTYEYLKDKTPNMQLYHTPLYGAICGAASWVVIYPSDPVKTIMQNENKGLVQAAKQVFSLYGLRGFYRGYTLGIFRAMPLHGGVFLGYEFFMKCVHLS